MKTVIITGANGQLGTVVTNVFLKKGYHVIATVRSEEDISSLPSDNNFYSEVLDLTNEEETRLFAERMFEKYKTIDAALLLAGGFAAGGIKDTDLKSIKKQITINFDTAYNIVHPLFEKMLENNSGRIVLIGSRPALNAAFGKNLIAYTLSKSLLNKLAELLNETAKGKNVTTTVVAPSTIDTEVNRKSMPEANTDDWVKPETLAEIFDFICSDSAVVLRETVLKVYNNA